MLKSIEGNFDHPEVNLLLKKHFSNLRYKISERDSFRPKRGTLSISKAKKLLNYKPKYSLEKGIEKYIHFLRFLFLQ